MTDRSAEGRTPDLVRIWTSPESDRPIRFGDYNPSLQFADEALAVFGDGRAVLFVLKTGNRMAESPAEWQTTFRDEVIFLKCKWLIELDLMIGQCKQVYYNENKRAF